MAFSGYETSWHWWTGSASQTQEFTFQSPVDIFAFGSLGAVSITGGQGCAFVGIMEYTSVDPNSGIKVTKNTMQGEFPVPILVAQKVTNVTFLFGSKTPSVSTVGYANASLNVFIS